MADMPCAVQAGGGNGLKCVSPVQDFAQKVSSGQKPSEPGFSFRYQVEDYVAKAHMLFVECKDLAKVKALELKTKTATLVEDPQFRTLTMTTAAGTVVFAAMGGAFGLALGMATGSIVGILLALFTFGLSIPIGAVIGGASGFALGVSTGAGVGALASYGTFKYWIDIKNILVYIKLKALDAAVFAKVKVLESFTNTKLMTADAMDKTKANAEGLTTDAKAKTVNTAYLAKAKAGEAVQFATTTRASMTCTSAAAGAVLGSTTGGGLGAISGAAIGIVPAVFTLGLSIPIGLICGLCIGASVGGAIGAMSGAAAGYGGFTYREEISSGALMAWDKTCSSAKSVKAKAVESATRATKSVKCFVGGSTGGTA